MFDPEESCLREQHLRFEQALSTSSITLNPALHSAVVIRGLGPCFAGARDGPFLIYARIGHGWRKIFEATGARLEPLNSTAKGWTDLALWFDSSGSQSVRYIYHFNGVEYVQACCDMVDYDDSITHKRTRQPIFRPCKGESPKP